MITIALTGDVMLGRAVNEALSAMRPEEPWGDTLPLLLESDLRIVNLECALTAHRQPWSRSGKVFHFRAGPDAVRVLLSARIDACALANNHTLDFEEQGLLDTIRHLDEAGVGHAGAGRNSEEAGCAAMLDAGAGAGRQRIALLSFTDNEPSFAARPQRPGTNYMEVALDAQKLGRIEASILAARQAGADIVIFSNHWGPNMVERPSVLFREFARKVIDLGADVYHGHSAHIFQGIEIYRGRPILYDTGDYIDDYAVDPWLRNDRSFLFRVVMEKGRLHRLDLFPVLLGFARVNRATGGERLEIVERMRSLSGEMGTELAWREDRLAYEAQSGP